MGKASVFGLLGRFYTGRETYRDVEFSFNNCKGKDTLVVSFFKKCMNNQGKECQSFYFLPEGLSEEKNAAKEFFGLDILEFPSLVPLRFDGKEFPTNATYEFIEYSFFLNMLDKFISDNYSEVYCDISQGSNIYLSALLDAFRKFIVFTKLKNLSRKESKQKFYLLFSDPILGSTEGKTYKIHTREYSVKTFFEIPLTREGLTELEKNNSISVEERKILKNAIRTFRAVKGNAPLVLFTFGYDKKENILETIKCILNRWLFELNETLEEEPDRIQGKKVYKIPPDIFLRESALLTLALYYDISHVLEGQKIPTKGKKWTNIKEIENMYKVYEIYDLLANKIILKKDLDRFKRKYGKSLIVIEYTLCELARNCGKVDHRNFWAHSGFEANITLIKNEFGRIDTLEFSYKQRDKVQKLILEK